MGSAVPFIACGDLSGFDNEPDFKVYIILKLHLCNYYLSFNLK